MTIKSFNVLQPGNNIRSDKATHQKKYDIPGKIFTLIIFLLGLTTGSISVWYLMSIHHRISDSTTDITKVIQAVSAHLEIPADEIPALATVTDSTKLNTPFLKNAKNGDKVLIYQTHMTAILYRPSIDKIVSVGPVSIDQPPKILN